MSYVNLDDQHEQGRLTRFRECLSGEVHLRGNAKGAWDILKNDTFLTENQ
jgi:hypothetical protein